MLKYVVRKFLMSKLNSILEKYQEDVLTVRNRLTSMITQLELVITAFKRVLTRLDDGKLTDEEVDETIADVDRIIKEW